MLIALIGTGERGYPFGNPRLSAAAPADPFYDLELLLARGVCPSAQAIERAGGYAAVVPRISEKLDLMGWALFRDQVLPALPREIQADIDEEEYLATRIRLLESLERCVSKHPGGGE